MYRFFKRLTDMVVSGILLILISPLMLFVAFLVKVTSKGPVIFKQDRIGKGGKVFKMYKFRSMCVGAEKMEGGVYCNEGDKRVTKVGKFIRKTSLDELPQLWNIFIGDMAFIGPRPVLTYHPWTFDKYTDEQKKMFNVRPGMTGYAQVNGRKTVEWNNRIKLNVYYVEHLSILMDLKILFKTVGCVFSSKDNVNVGETLNKDNNEQQIEQEKTEQAKL